MRADLDGARALLRRPDLDRRLVACDRDVDGLSAAVLVERTLERLGRSPPLLVPVRKGEHVQHPAMRERLRAAAPDALVVVDMGSRGLPILPGVPTLLIDHHQPHGFPPDAVVVSGFGREPVPATSLLAFEICRPLAAIDDLDWLALLGTVADLGADAPFSEMREALRRHGRKAVTETVALLNAARRVGDEDVAAALEVLRQAPSPAAIARGEVAGQAANIERLRRCRELVKAELGRAGRAAPKFAGSFALVRVSSPAQVHPLLAARWARRLPKQIVIVANDQYVPGRVSFAMRTRRDLNMIEMLRAIALPAAEGEWGFGHPQATGGSLAPPDFERLLAALGFEAAGAAGPAAARLSADQPSSPEEIVPAE